MLLNKVILKNHKLLTMKEKEPKNAEAVIKDIRRRPSVNLALRKKSELLFQDCVVMNPLTPFAEKKASHQRCIIDGAKTSLRPANGD